METNESLRASFLFCCCIFKFKNRDRIISCFNSSLTSTLKTAMEIDGEDITLEEELDDKDNGDQLQNPKLRSDSNSDSDSESDDESQQIEELRTLEIELSSNPANYDSHVQVIDANSSFSSSFYL